MKTAQIVKRFEKYPFAINVLEKYYTVIIHSFASNLYVGILDSFIGNENSLSTACFTVPRI